MQDDFGRTVGLRPSHWQQDDGSAADHAGDSEQLAVELTAAGETVLQVLLDPGVRRGFRRRRKDHGDMLLAFTCLDK